MAARTPNPGGAPNDASVHSLQLRGRLFAPANWPLVCTPLTGATLAALQSELELILPKRPDLLEWRVDHFADLAHIDQVVEAAKLLRLACGDVPLIFTRRAEEEGGEVTRVNEKTILDIYEKVCSKGLVDAIDFELSRDAIERARLRAVSRECGVAMIMSCHDFARTPSKSAMVQKLVDAAEQGADVAKLAVTPHTPDDVLLLLEATLEARKCVSIPLITMSMGNLGKVSRLCGWMFGSAVTFAVGSAASAPGQLSIEDLRQGLVILRGESRA